MTAQRARTSRTTVSTVIDRLETAYAPLRYPPQLDPLDELVLTILSQNTSDLNRDRAWAGLRGRFPGWSDVADAAISDIADAIRVGGLSNTKAPRLQHVLRAIRDDRGTIDLTWLANESDEDVRDYLVGLPGVGRKTAACVLAFSLRRPACPVDTHVHRIAKRLGWIATSVGADPAHAVLERLIDPNRRLTAHVALIAHGRRTCTAQRPACEKCPVASLCPRIGVA